MEKERDLVKRGVLYLYSSIIQTCIEALDEAKQIAEEFEMPEAVIGKLEKSKIVLADILNGIVSEVVLPNFVSVVAFIENFRIHASYFFQEKKIPKDLKDKEDRLNRLTYTVLEYLYDVLRVSERETLNEIKFLEGELRKAWNTVFFG